MKEYRAVLVSPDGDCAETTGDLDEVIIWAEKYRQLFGGEFELNIRQIEGGEGGCIGIT